MASSKTVDEYIERHTEREMELKKLRSLALAAGYTETIKWGMPTYTINGKNVVGIGSFKNWSCLWFHQGSFLKDKENVLENAQEGKTRGMRQWRFDGVNSIPDDKVLSYLQEAKENQLAGKEIKISKPASKLVKEPKELKEFLASEPKYRERFDNYTIAQRNEFMNYIIEAKRAKTKANRIEKIKEIIDDGKTLKVLWGG